MKNLFTGIEITFAEQLFDNTKHNQYFDHDGLRHNMLPVRESSIQRIERLLEGWLKSGNLAWAREFTKREDGIVTMYISGAKVSAVFKQYLQKDLIEDGILSGATCGSMKTDASFYARGR